MKHYILPFLVILLVSAKASAQSSTFSYTGSVQSYTAAVTGTFTVDMAGAAGGNSYGGASNSGGHGGRVVCSLAVTAGQVLNIIVAGQGITPTGGSANVSGGYIGGGGGTYYAEGCCYAAGGGGGASSVTIGGVPVVIAGGGGGGAYQAGGGIGGAGGGLTGGNGSGASGPISSEGGTQSAGGTGYSYSGYTGHNGSFEYSGGAGASSGEGGGGGGGYYGGGGGAFSGAGGGSSYTNPSYVTAVTHTQGYRSGNGYVIINPPACVAPAVPTVSTTASSYCVSGTSTLSIASGSLNGAAAWQWYSGSCGGTSVGTGTSVAVSPTVTTTYYVRGEGGCVSTPGSCGNTTVTVNALPTASISYSGTPYCATGTVTATQTGTTGGTYSSTTGLSLNSSSGAINLAASTAGTYTVTYSFTNSTCSNTTTTNVVVNALPAAGSITNGAQSVCAGSETATPYADATAANGTGAWSSSNTAIASVDGSGNVYGGATSGITSIIYTVTSGVGCGTATTSSPVTVNALPTANISYGGSPYCATGTASVTLTGTGGGTYSSAAGLSINSSSGDISLAGSTSGTYTVTYGFTNGVCSNTTTTVVTINPNPSVALTPANVSCNSANGGNQGNGSVSTVVTGGTSGYTYLWSNTTTAPTTTGLPVGTYSVTVTDANLCTAMGSAIVGAPSAISFTATPTQPTCSYNTGSVSLSAPGGGTGSIGYNSTPTTGLTTGSYTYTATDGNSCTLSQTIAISNPAAIVVYSISETDATCNGYSDGSITTGVTGGNGSYTYTWTPSLSGGGGGAAPGGPANPTGLAAGTYSVSVTDGNGCPAGTNSVVVGQPDAITVTSISATEPTCNGYSNGNISTTVTGGNGSYTYTWTPSLSGGGGGAMGGGGGGGGAEPGGPANPTGLAAGTYSVSVTDGNGCPAGTNSVVVGQPDAITVTSISATEPTCNGYSNGNISTTVTGGNGSYTYTWTPSLSGGGGGAMGGGGGGGGAEPGGPANPTGLAAGTYSVSVTDGNGCPAGTNSVVVGQPDAITVTSISATEPTCNGYSNGNISTTVTGGNGSYTYTWTPSLSGGGGGAMGGGGGGGGAEPGGPANPTGLAAGTYSVSVTDGNGCPAGTNSVVVGQPDAITVTSISAMEPTCNGYSNGNISTTVTGGNGSYTYTWTPSLSGGGGGAMGGGGGGGGAEPGGPANPTGLAAGTYSVSVTDGNGCPAGTNSVVVGQPGAITVTSISATEPTCNGYSNGSISTTVTGGNGSYTYTWTPSLSGGGGGAMGGGGGGGGAEPGGPANPTGLAAGTYSVSVTDGNGCPAGTNSVVVGQPGAITVTSISATEPTCNGYSNGNISTTVTGGNGSYTYTWTPSLSGGGGGAMGGGGGGGGAEPGGPANPTGLAAGTYSVSVTDGNGCPAGTNSVVVGQPGAITVTSISATEPTCNGYSNGSISTTVTGGNGSYTYTWTPSLSGGGGGAMGGGGGGGGAEPGGPANPTGLAAGTYSVSVTDGNGCPAGTNSVVVGQPGAVSVTAGNVSVCVGSTVTLPGSPSSGTWSVASAYSNTTPGTYSYTYTYTNGSGCTGSATSTITVNALPSVHISSSNNLTCTATSAILTASGAATYTWSGSSSVSSTRSVTAAGTYTVTGTGSDGCHATATYTETLTTTPLATPTVTVTNYCGSSTLTATGIVAGAAVTWSPSGSGNPLTVTSSGSYRATQSLSGCTSAASAAVTATPGSGLTLTPAIINVSCHGGSNGSITVSATGGSGTYTYSWSPCVGSSAGITGKAAGTYTVTVTNGVCHATGVYTITQPSAALAVSGTVTNVTCNGGDNGKITTTVTGGTPAYTYLWSPGGAATSGLSGKAAGTYDVTITDAHGCTVTGAYAITQPAALICAITATPGTTVYTGGVPTNIYLGYGPQTATLTATATGGSGYSYSWSSASGTGNLSSTRIANPVFTATSAGSYTYVCTITSESGCTTTCSVSICVTDAVDHSHAGNILVCHGYGCAPITVSCASGSVPSYITSSYCPSNHLGSIGSGCSKTGSRESGEDDEKPVVINELTVNAYPNPFNGEVNVKAQSNLADNVDVTVYDVTGRVMETKPGQPVESVISLGQNLVAGIYFIEVSQGGVVKKVKVVKY